jgi:hypothetical protein
MRMLRERLNSIIGQSTLPVLLIDKRGVARERVEVAVELLEQNLSTAELPGRTAFEVKMLLEELRKALA